MSGTVELSYHTVREIVDLLQVAAERMATPEQIDEMRLWADRLRDLAGPKEPTSYATRVLIGTEEWARESDSNTWWCLYTGLQDEPRYGFVWNELITRSFSLDKPLIIKELS